jgi:hypothetical protein
MLGYRKLSILQQFTLPMIKSFILPLALAHFLLASSAVAATEFFKCNVNGSVHYQQ